MARVSHKRVKQLLNEHRSKITDKQFFTSRILAGHYEDVAAAHDGIDMTGVSMSISTGIPTIQTLPVPITHLS